MFITWFGLITSSCVPFKRSAVGWWWAPAVALPALPFAKQWPTKPDPYLIYLFISFLFVFLLFSGTGIAMMAFQTPSIDKLETSTRSNHQF